MIKSLGNLKVGDIVYLRPLSTISKYDYSKYPDVVPNMYYYFGKYHKVSYVNSATTYIFCIENDQRHYYAEWMLGNFNHRIVEENDSK